MGIGMTRMLHVKIPVTDLQASVSWYGDLMDLALSYEFIEEGELRGAALLSEEGNFSFALRLRQYCASAPDLTGFDVVSLHMESRESLVAFHARCKSLGLQHTEVQDRSPNEAIVDVTDPDATVLRFYWVGPTADRQFVGMSFNSTGVPEFSGEPRLSAKRILGR
jgi:catechol 2,3-dioxygenase-like lactoylglutathione lyase family enzyme